MIDDAQTAELKTECQTAGKPTCCHHLAGSPFGIGAQSDGSAKITAWPLMCCQCAAA